jgi:hypothetical protein
LAIYPRDGRLRSRPFAQIAPNRRLELGSLVPTGSCTALLSQTRRTAAADHRAIHRSPLCGASSLFFSVPLDRGACDRVWRPHRADRRARKQHSRRPSRAS